MRDDSVYEEKLNNAFMTRLTDYCSTGTERLVIPFTTFIIQAVFELGFEQTFNITGLSLHDIQVDSSVKSPHVVYATTEGEPCVSMLKSYGYKNVITSLRDFTKEDILTDLDIDCKFKKSLCAFLDDDRNDVPHILFVELKRKLIDDNVVADDGIKINSSPSTCAACPNSI